MQMIENTSNNKKPGRIASIGFIVSWTVLVLYCYFREHPLAPEQVWLNIQNFQMPSPPTNLAKIALVAKHLGLACFLVIAGVLAGRRVLRVVGLMRPKEDTVDRWSIALDLLLALGVGWGLLMYLTFFVGVLGVLYTTAVFGILLILLLVCLRDVPPLFDDMKAILSPDRSDGGTIIERLALMLPLIMLLFLLIIALAPTITHDAMVYHLNVPRIYAEEHRITSIPYNLFSNTFLNLGMLYTIALLIDEFMLANLIHFVLGVGTLVFLYAFARGNFGRTTAALAVLIFFFNPSVLNELPIAYVDMGMVFFFLLALYCFWKWRETSERSWFCLMCFFAGVFAGIKYTSIHGLVSICLMIAAAEYFSGERRAGRAIGRLLFFGGAVTLMVLPYLSKNFLITGNPVYPLMYNFFDGRWLTPRQVERMLAYVNTHGMGHDWRSMLALPWNMTIHGNAGYANFDMAITPLWLVLLPVFVFIKPKPAPLKWAAFACVVYFLSWAASTHITRYLMPIFPLLSLICAHAIVMYIDTLGKWSRTLSVIFKFAFISACSLVWFSFAYLYPLKVPTGFGDVVWGTQTTHEFQTKRIPNYPVFRYINDNLPPGARLAFFWDNRGFFCERPQIGDSVFEAPSMMELVHETGSSGAFHRRLRKDGITHILFNQSFFRRFPVHTISEQDNNLMDADLKIFRDFQSRYCLLLFSAGGAFLYELR